MILVPLGRIHVHKKKVACLVLVWRTPLVMTRDNVSGLGDGKVRKLLTFRL